MKIARSIGRIGAMTLRYWYVLQKSWPRMLDLVYWPTVNMIVWGLLTIYFNEHRSLFNDTVSILLGAVMLWDVLLRGQLGFTYSFLEEIWSRNVANIMMSPIKPIELSLALMLMSFIRLIIGMAPVTMLAIILFGFNIYSLGLPLIAFFINLILLSWALGLVIAGLVLRNGQSAEGFSWSVMLMLLPLSCVYYPVSTLPQWSQPFAWMLPTTYVFEGMRELVLYQTFRADLMLWCLLLNAIYLALGVLILQLLIESARKKGSILAMGE
ncbi:MAG TPA: ABC transporter permease [Myxococcota bacterium]|nr:ABC transporter permease [Myxococcota bacterium]